MNMEVKGEAVWRVLHVQVVMMLPQQLAASL